MLCAVDKITEENAVLATKPKLIDIRAARIVAVQCLYSYQMTNSIKQMMELAQDIVSSWHEYKYFKFTHSSVNQPYLHGILDTALKNLDQMSDDISQFVPSASQIDKTPQVVFAILRVAISEIYNGKLDIGIIINEYLNITSYFNHDSHKGFVNSILDKVAKKYNP